MQANCLQTTNHSRDKLCLEIPSIYLCDKSRGNLTPCSACFCVFQNILVMLKIFFHPSEQCVREMWIDISFLTFVWQRVESYVKSEEINVEMCYEKKFLEFLPLN